jgi:hypothetical protein
MIINDLNLGNNARTEVWRPTISIERRQYSASNLLTEINPLASEQPQIIACKLVMSMAPVVDTAEIYLSVIRAANVWSIGDEIQIILGYQEEGNRQVFSGWIESISYHSQGVVRLTAINSGALLAQMHLDQSYAQQNSGAIVNDLLAQAEVSAGTITNGIDWPFYVIDGRSSLYQHIAKLANKNNYFAYFSAAGEFNFLPLLSNQALTIFTYGVDIIEFNWFTRAFVTEQLTLIGEGAAGSAGQEAWSWLNKNINNLTAAVGQGVRHLQQSDASLRYPQAVQTIAQNAQTRNSTYTKLGKLRVPGNSALQVGSCFAIDGMAEDSLNNTYCIQSVQHRFNKISGFITEINFCELPNNNTQRVA